MAQPLPASPTSSHTNLSVELLWVPSCSSNMPSSFLPLGFCTYCSLRLEHASSSSSWLTSSSVRLWFPQRDLVWLLYPKTQYWLHPDTLYYTPPPIAFSLHRVYYIMQLSRMFFASLLSVSFSISAKWCSGMARTLPVFFTITYPAPVVHHPVPTVYQALWTQIPALMELIF